jgi:hypothetical protein
MTATPRPIVIRLSTQGLKGAQDALKKVAAEGKKLGDRMKKVGESAGRARDRIAAIGRIGATAGKGIGVLAASATALAVGIGALAKVSYDGIDENIKFARSVGMTVEEFQKLRYAAEQGGVPVEDLRGQLFALSNISLAAFMGDEGAAESLARLGVSAVDANGELKTTYQSFLDIADAVSKVPDSLQKTASLAPVFGDGKLITTLNGGSAGLKKYGEEAERLGLILSTEQSELVERTNDSVDNLGRTVASARDRIALLLAPDIGRDADQLSSFIAENRQEIDEFAKSSFTFIRQSLLDIYNVLYNGADPETAWVASAAQSIRDIQALLTGNGEIESPFLSGIQVAFIEIGDAFDRMASQIDLAATVAKDFFFLISGQQGAISTDYVRGFIQPFNELSDTVSRAYRNVIKPVLDEFRAILDDIARRLNNFFGLTGDSAITGTQLAVVLAIAKVTGTLGLLVSVAGVAISAIGTIGKLFGGIALIAGGTAAAIAAVVAGVGAAVFASLSLKEQAKIAGDRAKEIAATDGEAAGAAYLQSFVDSAKRRWGVKAVNGLAGLVGLGVDFDDTSQQLDAIVQTDPEAAKKGFELAFQEMGIPLKNGVARVETQANVSGATLSPDAAAALAQLEAGVDVTSMTLSPSVQRQLESLAASLPAGSVPGFSTGGRVYGPGTSTSDSIIARLSRGEFVMRAASVRKFGADFFERLNSGVLPAFATGGLVSLPSPAGISSLSAMSFEGGGGRPVLLQLPDGSRTELRGSGNAVSDLEKRLRRTSVAQICRKPSWDR